MQTKPACPVVHLDLFFFDSRACCINVCHGVCCQMLNWVQREEKQEIGCILLASLTLHLLQSATHTEHTIQSGSWLLCCRKHRTLFALSWTEIETVVIFCVRKYYLNRQLLYILFHLSVCFPGNPPGDVLSATMVSCLLENERSAQSTSVDNKAFPPFFNIHRVHIVWVSNRQWFLSLYSIW